MNTLRQKFMLIAGVLLVLLLPVAWIFHRVYAPQLALREQQRLATMDPEVAGWLVGLSLENRFDLTDTLEFIRMLMRDGRPDEALRVFQQLHARHQDVPGIAFWYAQSLQDNRRWHEAEQAFLDLASRMEALHRENEGMDFSRARDLDLMMAYRRAGLPVTLMSVDPLQIYRHLGENALDAGVAASGAARTEWFERAEGYFQHALSLEPDAMDVRGAYANVLLQMNRPEAALDEYLWLLEREPDNTGWLESAAVAAAASRNFEAAEQFIRNALRHEARPQWRLELARFLSWGGRHEAALLEINLLIGEYPLNAAYVRERNQFLLNAERHREFLEATERWVALYPDEIPLRLDRMRAMIGLNRYEDAVREGSSVLVLAPDQFEAGLLRGEALLWMGRHGAAQEQFRGLEARNPDPAVRKRLAQSYLWGERPQSALPWFRMLHPERMNDLEVVQGFAEALSLQERISSDDLNAVLAIHSRIHPRMDEAWPPFMLAALSRVLARAGHPQEAVALLRSAVINRPEDLGLKLELADLLHTLGEFEEADQLYRLILSLT